MKYKKYIGLLLLISILIVSAIYFYNKYKLTKILGIISSNERYIKMYCTINNVQPRVYASIIFGELERNYDIFDNLDNLRAEYGYDPSVGFGQIRVSTFMWIEAKYSDGKHIKKSSSREELIRKIEDDKYNIAYTTLYVKAIEEKILNELHIRPTVKLIGSYYSLGIDHGGKLKMNIVTPVGSKAEEFYYSDLLKDLFPR